MMLPDRIGTRAHRLTPSDISGAECYQQFSINYATYICYSHKRDKERVETAHRWRLSPLRVR
jgi:hypothetical protein